MIGIINYGMGNLASVKNALDFLNIPNEFVNTADELKSCSKLILPGVGSFGMAMKNLEKLCFDEAIKEEVLIKEKPILGICLGMQLLLTDSMEYGFHKGLNFVQGHVLSFKELNKEIRVPHIGWNDVQISGSKLLELISEMSNPSFYFVHSFYCSVEHETFVTGITDYGFEFHSVFEMGHIMGCQFHPEKSQKNGLKIFSKFYSI